MGNVAESAQALKTARAVAKAEFQARMEQWIQEKTVEETARLSVEMHAAFNAGTTKEQLRIESGLYRSPLFNVVWDAVPYVGRDIKPGRTGLFAAQALEFEGRYGMSLIPQGDGYGIIVLSRDGAPLPETLTLPLRYAEGRDQFTVEDLPDMPDWWYELMRDGEYLAFQREVDNFAKHKEVTL